METGASSHDTDNAPVINGILETNHDSSHANNTSASTAPDAGTSNGDAVHHPQPDTPLQNGTPAPPKGRKRKLVHLDSGRSRSTSRAASPPWKIFAAEGPTQFTENGKRRSGRVNALPLELQPPSNKRQTRAAHEETLHTRGQQRGVSQKDSKKTDTARARAEKKESRSSTGSRASVNDTITVQSKKGDQKAPDALHSARSRTTERQPELFQSQSNDVAPDFKSPERRRTSAAVSEDHFEIRALTATITPRHPKEVLEPSRFLSLDELLAHYDKEDKEQAWKDRDKSMEGPEQRVVEKPHQTPEELAWKEAQTRLKILDAAKPGGSLSRDRCSLYLPDEQEEPPPQYSHNDHMWAQGRYFKSLMDKERRAHAEMSKKLAYWCLAAWKAKQPQTEEEKEREENEFFRLTYKQTVRDVQRKWELVTAEIDRRRLAAWTEKEEIDRERKMQDMLEKSTRLLNNRRARLSSELSGNEADEADLEDEDDEEMSDGSDEDPDMLDQEDDHNMTSSESDDSDEGDEQGDPDTNLTVEELRAKYESIPELPVESEDLDVSMMDVEDQVEAESVAAMDDAALLSKKRTSTVEPSESTNKLEAQLPEELDETKGLDVSNVPLDEVDAVLLDESDESTDMSDDMGSSDEEEEGSEEGSGSDDDEQDEDNSAGLWGFFGKQDRPLVPAVGEDDATADIEGQTVISSEAPKQSQLFTPPAEEDERGRDSVRSSRMSVDGALPSADPHGEDQSSQLSLKDDTTAVPTETESTTSIDPFEGKLTDSAAATPQPMKPSMVKIPTLLRGNLREYQHFGLDWLAKLYANNTNGILADEMGLGKTIQTIALLAHLAEEHEVWGPHLIIVPTSVILNWEMEFKKFLPGFKVLSYYGTVEERAQKRKGWSNPDNWNVVITSYQLVLKDLLAIRVPEWHYMILDEAHNIKNFNSQRYQAMIRLKTRARLLLTGTPLQNSIIELWSLLTFLTAGQDGQGMGSLDEFTEWFRRPVDEIFVDGKSKLGLEAQSIVSKLHHSLRPYLLRRMKSTVEQQLPGKYEHTVMCRLSKRQRQLYDAFMSRADTKANLSSGNMISVSQALMALRKVCNHPDLFEERPINTSFVMFDADIIRPRAKMAPSKAVVADYEIKELLIRKYLMVTDGNNGLNLDSSNLSLVNRERHTRYHIRRSRQFGAGKLLQRVVQQQSRSKAAQIRFDGSSLNRILAHQRQVETDEQVNKLQRYAFLTDQRTKFEPVYGRDLVQRATVYTRRPTVGEVSSKTLGSSRYFETSSLLQSMVRSVDQRSEQMNVTIEKFGCITPNAVALDLLPFMTPTGLIEPLRKHLSSPEPDAFHEARVRLSIAFPDKRLLQYDCGKLQRLATLLRDLKSRGSRALIFTQMTQVLDILEQFLNIHGYRYLRLDGSTKIEQRQDMMERFNRDTRIDVFILSSRSGGVGMNLTGADAVIFYDLDWNPQMDKQCQDRAHRIGQTRDVHIYKFVSEHTIEVNIFRKSNQKRLLDEVVIQEGEFTTDYFNRVQEVEPELDEDDVAGAAIDRVFGGSKDVTKVLEAVEDREDAEAARAAENEITADFDFDNDNARTRATPKTSVPPTPAADAVTDTPVIGPSTATNAVRDEIQVEDDARPHVDEYMLRFIENQLKEVPFVPPIDKSKKGRLDKNGRDRSHRPKR
ncbi:swr1 complex component [Taxawa tesnikishii (nom. ined.)]|nr:swr1 complex component [Dothideales sp. JES 119]